jgi:hypothetical protein
MNKSLIHTITICAISAMAIIPFGYVSANDDNGTLPHVDGNYQ